MVRIRRRIELLAQALLPAEGPPKRWVVVVPGVGPANLANASCTRTRSQGRLWEVVRLDGSREGLTDAALDRFVQSFPIQDGATA